MLGPRVDCEPLVYRFSAKKTAFQGLHRSFTFWGRVGGCFRYLPRFPFSVTMRAPWRRIEMLAILPAYRSQSSEERSFALKLPSEGRRFSVGSATQNTIAFRNQQGRESIRAGGTPGLFVIRVESVKSGGGCEWLAREG
jgi:hypothetical protein